MDRARTLVGLFGAGFAVFAIYELSLALRDPPYGNTVWLALLIAAPAALTIAAAWRGPERPYWQELTRGGIALGGLVILYLFWYIAEHVAGT